MYMNDIKTQVLSYAVMLWRRRWRALAVAWVVCLVGWAVVLALPDRYRATARIYADTQTLLSPLLKGISVNVDMNQQIEIMQRTLISRPNLESVVRMTDLDLTIRTPEEREGLIDRLRSNISLRAEQRNLFRVSYESADPQLAKRIVESLLTIFVESNLGISRRDMEQARRFIDGQIEQYESQLARAESRLAAFKSKHIDVLPETGNHANLVQRERDRLRSLRVELEEAVTRRQGLERQLTQIPRYVEVQSAVPNWAFGNGGRNSPASLFQRVEEARSTLDALLLQYTDRHPDVIATKRVLAALEADLEAAGGPPDPASGFGRATESISNDLYTQIQLRLVEADSQVRTLERRYEAQQREVERREELAKTAPAVQAEFINLERDYNVIKRNYEELLDRRESARMSQEVDTKADKLQFRIVDPPQVPSTPSGPNRPLYMSIVLLLGLGAGGFFAFVLAQMNDSFGTPHHLRQAFALPVLGSISAIPNLLERGRRLASTAGFTTAFLGLIAGYACVLLVVTGALQGVPELMQSFDWITTFLRSNALVS